MDSRLGNATSDENNLAEPWRDWFVLRAFGTHQWNSNHLAIGTKLQRHGTIDVDGRSAALVTNKHDAIRCGSLRLWRGLIMQLCDFYFNTRFWRRAALAWPITVATLIWTAAYETSNAAPIKSVTGIEANADNVALVYSRHDRRPHRYIVIPRTRDYGWWPQGQYRWFPFGLARWGYWCEPADYHRLSCGVGD
jgi:hypothetical protein